ncbi:MAG: hypothetical protein U0821_12085 [Chloroflexota bacterium]
MLTPALLTMLVGAFAPGDAWRDASVEDMLARLVAMLAIALAVAYLGTRGERFSAAPSVNRAESGSLSDPDAGTLAHQVRLRGARTHAAADWWVVRRIFPGADIRLISSGPTERTFLVGSRLRPTLAAVLAASDSYALARLARGYIELVDVHDLP